MTKVILDVPAIDCPHCSRAISKALQPREGVRTVRVDVEGQQVHLEFDEQAISLDQVKDILAEADYEVEAVTAA
jgi:copper chaperone